MFFMIVKINCCDRIIFVIQYLDMICNCGRGLRTIGTCNKRCLLRIRNLFTHPITTHMANYNNIEQNEDSDMSVSDDGVDI